MLTRSTGPGDVTFDAFKSSTQTSGAGTAATVTLNASAGHRHILHHIQWSYDTTPTGGKLTIAVNAVTKFEVDITAAGPGGFGVEFVGGVNQAVVITLAGGGGAVIGKLNVQYTTERDLP